MLRRHPGPTCPAGHRLGAPGAGPDHPPTRVWRDLERTRRASPSLPQPSCLLSPHLRVGGRWVTPASNSELCCCNYSSLASPHIPPNQCLSPAKLCPQLGGATARREGTSQPPRPLPSCLQLLLPGGHLLRAGPRLSRWPLLPGLHRLRLSVPVPPGHLQATEGGRPAVRLHPL